MFSLSPVSSNHSLSDDNIGAMGISRSTTSSPVPQSMQSTAWITCRRMIYIKNNPPSGHWPVPESFWPDPSMQALVCMFYGFQIPRVQFSQISDSESKNFPESGIPYAGRTGGARFSPAEEAGSICDILIRFYLLCQTQN